MERFSPHWRLAIPGVLVMLALAAGLSQGFFAPHSTSARTLHALSRQISRDPFTNSTSQHQTQVEPDTLSFGPIVVSAFQSGRFFAGGGSSGITWATSFDAGKTWQTGTPLSPTLMREPESRVEQEAEAEKRVGEGRKAHQEPNQCERGTKRLEGCLHQNGSASTLKAGF